MICQQKQKQVTVSTEAANSLYTAHFFWGLRRRHKTTVNKLDQPKEINVPSENELETCTRVACFVRREV